MKTNIKIHRFEDIAGITNAAFDLFLKENSCANERFFIIPGGSTPKPFLNILANEIKDWSNTIFILSDERLSSNKEFSNEHMVDKELLMKITESEKPVLIRYNRFGDQKEIEKILNYKIPVLTILGLGSDGHCASLFPGNSGIFSAKSSRICLKVNNPWEQYSRISLSFSYLMKSKKIIFLVSGKDKAEALKECLVGDYNPIQYPAQFIFRNYKNTIYILCDNLAGEYIV